MKKNSERRRDLYYSDTSIIFLNSDKRSPVAAHPRVELNRGPAIFIDFDELPSELEDDYMNALISDMTIPIRLAYGSELEVASFFPDPPGGTLVVLDREVDAVRNQEYVDAVHFALINFDAFVHPHLAWDHDSQDIRSYTRLVGSGWEIDVQNANGQPTFEPGGFDVTHWGDIKRCDGRPFQIASVKSVLEALGVFFSFVRGGYCGISLINGTNGCGERVWEQWSVSHVTPQRRLDSWFEPTQHPVLREVFLGFWCHYQDHRGDTSSQLALQWYLESNIQESDLTSIILNQAALERLASIHVGGRMSARELESDRPETEGAWIARALENVGIGVAIPPQLVALEQWRADNRFEHGPQSIVEARNDLIHHEMRRGILSDEVYVQASALGLWYVELLLLKQFGYQGHYRNRLTEAYESIP